MMLDAHKQLNDKGVIVEEICLYCHAEKPDEKNTDHEEVKLIGNLEVICQRCHAISGNHSGNFNHMVKPSAKYVKIMKQMEAKFDIILPLDEEGKLTCITCHNPHQKGVIPSDRKGAKGADSKFRHRLPGKLCLECHQM
jgi:ribosomal protein L40E